MKLKFITGTFKNILLPDLKEWSEKTGINIYVVGGACRDHILTESNGSAARRPKDIDFCVESPQGAKVVIEYLSQLKCDDGDNKYKVTIVDDFPKIGTMVVSLECKYGGVYHKFPNLEIAMTRKEIYSGQVRRPSKIEFASVNDDALRRDFCCNAVYYNIRTETFVDPTGKGIQDAKNNIYRTIKDPETSFREDPLRMIRCIRFWHTNKWCGGSVEKETLKAIHYYPEYDQISLDLIRPELEKILVHGAKNNEVVGDRKSSDAIRFLHERGLLKHILPEFEEAWGFNQNSPYHSMNLSDHLLATLDWVQLYSPFGSCGLHNVNEALLCWACLLHDISKYKTYQIKKDNYFSYHNHERTSAEMAEEILKRLGYGKVFASSVGKIITCHMYLKQFWDPIAQEYNGTDKQTRKIWEKIAERSGDHMDEVLALIDADNNTHAPDKCRPSQVYQFDIKYKELEKLNTNGYTLRESRLPELPSGEMVKDALKLSKEEMPVIGQVLSAMKDIVPLQSNYSKMTKEDIIAFYLGMFDQNFYIRKRPNIGQWSYTATINNPFDAIARDESLEITDKLTRDRIEKIFEQNKDPRLIDADILRKQVKGKLIQTNDEKVLVLNAQTFPWILIRYRIFDQIDKCFEKINEGLREISQLPDFASFELENKDGDVTAIVDFYSGFRKVII